MYNERGSGYTDRFSLSKRHFCDENVYFVSFLVTRCQVMISTDILYAFAAVLVLGELVFAYLVGEISKQ